MGCVITLLGFVLYRLIHSVKFPASRSVLGTADGMLTLCLAIMNKNMNKFGKQDRTWGVLQYMVTALDDVIVLGSNTIALVFKQSHRIRFVMEIPGIRLNESLTISFEDFFRIWNDWVSVAELRTFQKISHDVPKPSVVFLLY